MVSQNKAFRYAMAFESIGWIQTKVVGIGHNDFFKFFTNHQSLLKCSDRPKSAWSEIGDSCKLRMVSWHWILSLLRNPVEQ